MSDREQIGQRIRQIRDDNRLTQVELADRLGVNVNTVRRWESTSQPANPNSKELVKIVDAFGVDPGWLLIGGEKKDSPKEPAQVDGELLSEVIQGVIGALDDKGLELPKEKLAELITIMYDYGLKGGFNKETVERMLRLVA